MMADIVRDIEAASKEQFDLIVIGGGIHGVMLALAASLGHLKTLLIEKSDFGAATSYNSLRILHGGFRYLQSFDLQRLYESAGERTWYLQFFPELARPLSCLMPLYGEGLRRPFILGSAIKAYNFLTAARNKGVKEALVIPDGRLLNAAETRNQCRYFRNQGLKGGAVWYDGFIPDTQKVLMGALRWGCEYGLHALNYVRAVKLIQTKGVARGVIALDEETGLRYEFMGTRIINAAGPWCRELAAAFDRDQPSLFHSMLAWNVLFDRKSISPHAVAVSPPGPAAHTYFVVPWKGKVFAGTGQAPWAHSNENPGPSSSQLQHFCADLNRALPGIDLGESDILHVFSGLQSAQVENGTDFSKRDVFISHADRGGPKGLYSISGIKFTTARKAAEKVIRKIYPEVRFRKDFYDRYPPPADATAAAGVYDFDWVPDLNDTDWKNEMIGLIREESAIHIDDLVIRRTSLGDNPSRALNVAPALCDLFNWDQERKYMERERLEQHFRGMAKQTKET